MPQPIFPIRSAARRLQERGLVVIPCRGKKPTVKWGERSPTRDELADALKDPALNIAIALDRSPWIDVECDSPEAEANLSAIFSGGLPKTPTWKSARGAHRLFVRPAGVPDTAKLVVDGVEFRGLSTTKAALSVVPPSRHETGVRYAWLPGLSLFDVEPAELPADVVALLRAGGRSPLVEPAPDGGRIPEGNRNDELFKLGCQLAATGVSPEALAAALQAENVKRCKPPLPEAEVAGIAKSASEQDPLTVADLMSIAMAEAELWHTGENVPYATITKTDATGEHGEHYRLRSNDFKHWLSYRFYKERGRAPGPQPLASALATLEGVCQFEGEQHEVHLRVAGHDGRVFIDLRNDQWSAIEVDNSGWRVTPTPPVRFRRAKGGLPLPEPVRGGSVALLRQFTNVSDDQWPLLLGWLVGAFHPTGPFPIATLLGEQGSSKSTLAKILRRLIDPSTAPTRRPPRSDRDLMISAVHSWVVSFDNMTGISVDLADALCSLATGGALTTRQLYSDDTETILAACRPVVLNGIESPSTRSDLLDRSLVLELPKIGDADRRDERTFWAEFETAAPAILGALLDGVAAALRNADAVRAAMKTKPRMADHAVWVEAAAPALGLTANELRKAYKANRDAANSVALESNPVGSALLDLTRHRPRTLGGKLVSPPPLPFDGTAAELLKLITTGEREKQRGWPGNARALAGIVTRLSPALRSRGFSVEHLRRRGARIITIAYSPPGPRPSVAAGR
jgi:hypothetical protein